MKTKIILLLAVSIFAYLVFTAGYQYHKYQDNNTVKSFFVSGKPDADSFRVYFENCYIELPNGFTSGDDIKFKTGCSGRFIDIHDFIMKYSAILNMNSNDFNNNLLND